MLDWTLVLGCGVATLGLIWWVRKRSSGPHLDHVPGPPGYPVVGNTFQLKLDQMRLQIDDWSEQYGPVMKLKLLIGDIVVLSGYEAQNEALVTKTAATGGRPVPFRHGLFSENTGIVGNEYPDERWRVLRKVSHRHVKQFGDGLAHIEKVVFDVSEDMFFRFQTAADDNEAFDPLATIRATALKIIAFLIVGKRLRDDDDFFKLLNGIEPMVWKALSLEAPEFVMLDLMPALFHVPSKGRSFLKEMMAEKEKFATQLAEIAGDGDNLMTSLMQEVRKEAESDDAKSRVLSERDPALTCLNMLVAGLASTSMTFYTFLNVLAQNQEIQSKIRQEITSVVPPDAAKVTLDYKSDLHYTRAAVFEILRFFTVTPLVPHKTTKDTEIQGIPLPKDTQLLINSWGLHHDKKFWGDPERFRPDRFVDHAGKLLPPDHPTRRHLRPFSAGIRVCLGEQMALARLFLWTANLLRKFQILPAEGSTPTSADTTTYKDSFVLLPAEYKIYFKHVQQSE